MDTDASASPDEHGISTDNMDALSNTRHHVHCICRQIITTVAALALIINLEGLAANETWGACTKITVAS